MYEEEKSHVEGLCRGSVTLVQDLNGGGSLHDNQGIVSTCEIVEWTVHMDEARNIHSRKKHTILFGKS